MPMIDVTMSTGALNERAKDGLAERLTADLIELEGAVDNPYVRSLTWVFFDERDDIRVSGTRIDRPVYRVVHTVPQGTGLVGPLALRRRQELVTRVTIAILEAEGTPFSMAEARRVWVQVREIPDTHWGAFGEIVTMRDIVAYSIAKGPDDLVGHTIRAALKTVIEPNTSDPTHAPYGAPA